MNAWQEAKVWTEATPFGGWGASGRPNHRLCTMHRCCGASYQQSSSAEWHGNL